MRKNGGFTLIELLIVIGILVILSGMVIGAFVIFNRSQGVDKDTELVLETLRLARSQTLASKNETQYGVHFSSSSITLFSGSSYSQSASGNVVFSLNANETLSTNLISGGQDIIFNRLTGTTDDSGTVTLSSSVSPMSKSVTIYGTGLIQGSAL